MLFLIVLAAALQPSSDTAPPAPGEWAWLNIPDREGPGARFSYETAVGRDGQQLEIRYRFEQNFSPAPGERPVGIEARIALDCAARTVRILDWRSLTPGIGLLYNRNAEPVRPNTREAVLMQLLCPTGVRPLPANAAGQEG